MPHPYQLRYLNEALFEGRGDYRYSPATRCGIVVRGEIQHHIPNPVYRSQQVRVRLPNGRLLELVNVHLQAASTDLSLWRRECWRTHHRNRKLRRGELALALDLLDQGNQDPRLPAVIVAGDFNAPAGDRIYRMLRKDFTDTFSAAGTGWGNTYHRRFPILRLDHVFVSNSFIPVRSRVVTIEESDHRMVVSDLILQ
jgi:endonuclease/exonuclease/phosphatase family metal-dependent hydrolase